MNAKPNPCTTPSCGNAVPDVSTDHAGVGMVRCPKCLKAEWGDDRDRAVIAWNIAHPRPVRWLYVVAVIAIAIGLGALLLLI